MNNSTESLFNPSSAGPAEPTKGKSALNTSKIFTVLGILMALLLTYAVNQLHKADVFLRQQNEQLIKQVALDAKRLDDNDVRMAELTANLHVSTERLGLTQSELNRTREIAARIRQEQQQRVEDLNKQLEQKASSEQLAALQQQTTSTLGSLSSDVSSTRQEVATVGKDVATTKQEVSDMKLKISEHGSMIAQNGNELAYLRRRGERDYFEFNIRKGGFNQVSDLRLQLKGTDTKKQRFNLEYMADDRKVKRDKVNANEPILVYVAGLKQPYEIVVNRVDKDHVVGYVSAPKDRGAAPGKSIQ